MKKLLKKLFRNSPKEKAKDNKEADKKDADKKGKGKGNDAYEAPGDTYPMW